MVCFLDLIAAKISTCWVQNVILFRLLRSVELWMFHLIAKVYFSILNYSPVQVIGCHSLAREMEQARRVDRQFL
jgi:hypothetical protein